MLYARPDIQQFLIILELNKTKLFDLYVTLEAFARVDQCTAHKLMCRR